jgi:hypothetical protein
MSVPAGDPDRVGTTGVYVPGWPAQSYLYLANTVDVVVQHPLAGEGIQEHINEDGGHGLIK